MVDDNYRGERTVKTTPLDQDRESGDTPRSASKALPWFIAMFLFILLILFALFLYTGVFVLRNSQGVVAALQDLQEQVSVNGLQIGGMSNRLTRIEGVQHRLIQKSSSESTKLQQSIDVLRGDVQRFSRWIATREGLEERIRRDVTEQIRVASKAIAELEDSLKKTEGRISELPTTDVIEAKVSEAVAAPSRSATSDDTDDGVELLSTTAIERFFDDAREETAQMKEQTAKPGALEVSIVSLPDGSKYQGEIRGGLFAGWGTLTLENGDRYEGYFENDLKHGAGTLTQVTGERYVGEFKNGVRSGRGSLYMVDGNRYVGDFREDHRTGKGVMIYADGDRYAGEFRSGRRHGKGVMVFSNGDIYQGEFRDDIRTGQGAYLFSDGFKYIGSFRDNHRDGEGRFVYTDGTEYRGAFKAGQKHGQGYRIYPGGVKVKGLWEEDRHIRDIRE